MAIISKYYIDGNYGRKYIINLLFVLFWLLQVEPLGWTDVHGWTSQGGSLLGTKKYIFKK